MRESSTRFSRLDFKWPGPFRTIPNSVPPVSMYLIRLWTWNLAPTFEFASEADWLQYGVPKIDGRPVRRSRTASGVRVPVPSLPDAQRLIVDRQSRAASGERRAASGERRAALWAGPLVVPPAALFEFQCSMRRFLVCSLWELSQRIVVTTP